MSVAIGDNVAGTAYTATPGRACGRRVPGRVGYFCTAPAGHPADRLPHVASAVSGVVAIWDDRNVVTARFDGHGLNGRARLANKGEALELLHIGGES